MPPCDRFELPRCDPILARHARVLRSFLAPDFAFNVLPSGIELAAVVIKVIGKPSLFCESLKSSFYPSKLKQVA